MYIAARRWGIQPSEFWNMTPMEWNMEAYDQWVNSEAGQKAIKVQKWAEDAELSEDEWKAKHLLTDEQWLEKHGMTREQWMKKNGFAKDQS